MKAKVSIVIFIILVTIACVVSSKYQFREMYHSHNELIHSTANIKEKPFLKAHLTNGSVCIFDDKWVYDSLANIISGAGKYYDFQRNEILGNDLHIHVDSVALFETNTKLTADKSSRVQKMSILTSIDVMIGLLCLSSPKACFGSCPTFYLEDGDYYRLADAESFSNAIAPSLEYIDIDDLGLEADSKGTVNLKMMNEALETHVVKRANLDIIPKYPHEQVYLTPDDQYIATSNGPNLATALSGNIDVKSYLVAQDGNEYFSLADTKALVTKEDIFLEFDDAQDLKYGLKLSYRQTMMTTYALYSAIGYMGDEVGDFFAKIELSKETSDKMHTMFYDALGGIEIRSLQADGSWKYEGEMYETGPIARNHELLPLNYTASMNGKIKLKLTLNKGLWRLDHAALLKIERICSPIEVQPNKIVKNGVENRQILKSLTADQEDFILSMPGDLFRISYQLPACRSDQNFKVFLKAKGYYIEWMRDSWLKDKDLLQLYRLMNHPVDWLNSETANYKKYEADMEEQFWNSRWTQKNKSYEEL